MNAKKNILVLSLLLAIVFGCEDKNEISTPDAVSVNYAQLENQLKNDFSKVAKGANALDLFIGSQAMKEAFQKQYDRTSFYMQFGTVLDHATARALPTDGTADAPAPATTAPKPTISEITITSKSLKGVEEIGLLLNNSASFEELIIDLDVKFKQVSKDATLSTKDKQYLLTYITTYKVAMDHVFNGTPLPTANNARTQGWWSSWGKCAAGIIGGGLTGAVTLGLGGAAVGTVALPVVGTVSAGAVGAIVGGIGGALTGAAASCDGKLATTEDMYMECKYLNGKKLCIDTRPVTILPVVATPTSGLRPIRTVSKITTLLE